MTVAEAKEKMLAILNEQMVMEEAKLYHAIGAEPILGRLAKSSLKRNAILEVAVSGKEYLLMLPQEMTDDGIVVRWDDLKKAMGVLTDLVGEV